MQALRIENGSSFNAVNTFHFVKQCCVPLIDFFFVFNYVLATEMKAVRN